MIKNNETNITISYKGACSSNFDILDTDPEILVTISGLFSSDIWDHECLLYWASLITGRVDHKRFFELAFNRYPDSEYLSICGNKFYKIHYIGGH